MTKKKSQASRPYMIAVSFFVILFLSMKLQDFRSQTVAENPFDKIENRDTQKSNQRTVAAVPNESFQDKNLSDTNKNKNALKNSWAEVQDHLKNVEKRRNEVKTALAVLFMMQRSFQAEHNRFTSDMAMMSMDFPEELGFKFGFANSFTPQKLAEGENPKSTNTDFLLGEQVNQEGSARLHYKEETLGINLQNYLHLCRRKCEVTENSFEAIAVMPIPGGNDVDVFLVNDKKEIFHVYNGVTQKGFTN